MNSVTFKGWVARDKIDDEYYPRTFLYANKPRKKKYIILQEIYPVSMKMNMESWVHMI